MKLIGHIVQKDFRRMWVPLALWVMLLLAKDQVGVFALAHDGVNLDRFVFLEIAAGVVLGLEILVSVVLVAVLVQEDTLVGTEMFWATRPIGSGRLLAAKLISTVLMFGVLPVLASLPWWLRNGYGVREMLPAIGTVLDWQALTVLPALVLAVLTKNPLRFFGALLVLAVALAVVMIALPLLGLKETRFGVTQSVMQTRGTLVVLTFVAGAAVVIGWQFFTRRLATALVAIALTVFAAIGFGSVWPWGWSSAARKSESALAAAITIEPMTVKIQSVDNSDVWIQIDYALRGKPEEMAVSGLADNTWRWADGGVEARPSWLAAAWPGWVEWRALGLPRAKTDPIVQAWLRSGTEHQQDWGVKDDARLRSLFFLHANDVARLRTTAPAFVAKLQAQLLQPEREFEIPLREGEQLHWAGNSVRIVRAEWRAGELSVAVIESEAWVGGYSQWRPGLTSPVVRRAGHENIGFSLVNRARGEAIRLWERQRAQVICIGTQWINWRIFSCALPRDPDELTGRPPRWLDGATLAGVRFHPVDRLDREVKIARFEFEAAKETAR